MIYYLFLPFLLLFIVVMQNTIPNVVFLGRFSLELPLILVIYAGFNLDIVKGAIICFLLGYFLDCSTGAISGFHILIYSIIFIVSTITSLRFSLEKPHIIIAFVYLCALLKGALTIFLYTIIYSAEVSDYIKNYLLQSIVVSMVSPFVFWFLNFAEGFIIHERAKSYKRS